MNTIHRRMPKFDSFLFSTSLDIQFWRSRKTLEGLSVRSVFFNVFQSVIVLLYVMDNETNTVIIISCFVGLLIEIWKINKAVDLKVMEPFTGIFYLEVMGLNPIHSQIFFRLSSRSCFSCMHNCDGLSCTNSFIHSSNICTLLIFHLHISSSMGIL